MDSLDYSEGSKFNLLGIKKVSLSVLALLVCVSNKALKQQNLAIMLSMMKETLHWK